MYESFPAFRSNRLNPNAATATRGRKQKTEAFRFSQLCDSTSCVSRTRTKSLTMAMDSIKVNEPLPCTSASANARLMKSRASVCAWPSSHSCTISGSQFGTPASQARGTF